MRKRTKGVLIRLTDDEFYDLTNRVQNVAFHVNDIYDLWY